MNHFLLPEQRGGSLSLEHYGAHAMELLINGMLKAGASRENLTAKAFGGASIQKDLGSVGEQNAKFVLSYLNLEGIDCIANSLGGHQGRLIRFYPASGRAQQMFIGDPPVVAPPKEYNQSDITFFED